MAARDAMRAREARPATGRRAPRRDSSVTPAELAEMRRELGEAVPEGAPADVTRVCLRLEPSGAPMVERETLAVLVATGDRRKAEAAAMAAARMRGMTGEVIR